MCIHCIEAPPEDLYERGDRQSCNKRDASNLFIDKLIPIACFAAFLLCVIRSGAS
jgi:hypothetical protein